MIIGNKPEGGEKAEIGKWYAGIEICSRPPTMIRIFRPYIFVWCLKWLSFEEVVFRGKESEKKGGWWSWTSPVGITFEIHKF